MLDKSVPYLSFTMIRPSTSPTLPEISLPEGYRFTFYQPGDELDWCRIETSVLEFDSLNDAADYFETSFTPYPKELEQRMVFIENPAGIKVATFTAWWTAEKLPRLHWLGVIPEEQGKGLATALAIKITQLLHEYYPDQDLYLTTQTWSHSAVRLYQNLNFQIEKNGDYQQIVKILNDQKN